MQENEFEKNLQQKLDALQVQPTGEVWQKIKEQVAEKKRKRRFAFLFLLVALLGAAAFITTVINKPVEQKQIAIESTQKNEGTNTVAAQTVPNTGNEIDTADKNRTDISSPNTKVVKGATKQDDQEKTIHTSLNKRNRAGTQKVTIKNSSAVETVVQTSLKRTTKGSLKMTTIQPMVEEEEKNKEVDKVDVAIVEANPEGNEAVSLKNENKHQTNVNVETKTAVEENKEQQIEILKENKKTEEKKNEEKPAAESAKKSNKDQSNKWGIAFFIAGGRSSVKNSSGEKAFLEDYSGGGIVNNPNTGNAGGNYYKPSALQPGASFTAGVGVYRKLSSAFKIMIGVQYGFNTLTIKTGSRIDSAGVEKDLFGLGNSSTYTNKYHYLTMPISFSADIFSIGKKQITVDAGVSISKLLFSNVLEFNAAQGRYYADASGLNKTPIALSVSAGINLAGVDKPALYIGPQFNYNLTPLASAGLHGNKRMAFIGLRIQKNLWK